MADNEEPRDDSAQPKVEDEEQNDEVRVRLHEPRDFRLRPCEVSRSLQF